MAPIEAIIHPESLRGLAYQVLNALYGAGPTDDSNITIYQIEDELKLQERLLLDKDDEQRLKLGQRPDPSRVVSRTITLSEDPCEDCHPEQRMAELPEYMAWNGAPYITNVSACGVNFVPVVRASQLPVVARRTGKPTFVIIAGAQASKIKVHMTAQTNAVGNLEVEGAYKDQYYGLDRNSPVFWLYPWNADSKGIIKERAEIRLRGGSVATYLRADKRNNGVETPVNQPTT